MKQYKQKIFHQINNGWKLSIFDLSECRYFIFTPNKNVFFSFWLILWNFGQLIDFLVFLKKENCIELKKRLIFNIRSIINVYQKAYDSWQYFFSYTHQTGNYLTILFYKLCVDNDESVYNSLFSWILKFLKNLIICSLLLPIINPKLDHFWFISSLTKV